MRVEMEGDDGARHVELGGDVMVRREGVMERVIVAGVAAMGVIAAVAPLAVGTDVDVSRDTNVDADVNADV